MSCFLLLLLLIFFFQNAIVQRLDIMNSEGINSCPVCNATDSLVKVYSIVGWETRLHIGNGYMVKENKLVFKLIISSLCFSIFVLLG